jgi:uncharacterized protein (DUF849 family)
MENLIINFTPTGMIPTKKMSLHVPLTPEEIINDVREACTIGISMTHLHIRDENGEPHFNKDIYRRVILGIREFAPELVICASTSGRMHVEFWQRSDVLLLEGYEKPDMGSLTLSSLNFNQNASINEPDMIKALAKTMKEQGIRPELEAFDSGMINYSKYLNHKKLIAPPFYFNLILGNIACAQANLLSAGHMVSELPEMSISSFGGIGNEQLKMNSMAISMGFGVRVGLEDNIWYDTDRTTLATNTMLLERVHNIARANNRDIMKPKELRTLLNLEKGNGKYGVAD